MRHPASAHLPAAFFWRAKCRIKRGEIAAARQDLDSTVASDPFDYYAHRARALLADLGDSLAQHAAFDTVADTSRAIRWLDSVAGAPPRPLTPDDSADLRRGTVCATAGDIDDAEIFLEPIECTYTENLSLEFRIAVFYRNVNACGQSTRAGRRLFNRIPPVPRCTAAAGAPPPFPRVLCGYHRRPGRAVEP